MQYTVAAHYPKIPRQMYQWIYKSSLKKNVKMSLCRKWKLTIIYEGKNNILIIN